MGLWTTEAQDALAVVEDFVDDEDDEDFSLGFDSAGFDSDFFASARLSVR